MDKKWFYIATFPLARCELGVSGDGIWGIKKINQENVTYFSDKDVRSFVCCLEEQLVDIRKKLSDGLTAKGFSASLEKSFPYEKIVIEGLNSRSDKWIHLCINWLSEIVITDEVVESVRNMIARKDGSQKDRQVARRFLSAQT